MYHVRLHTVHGVAEVSAQNAEQSPSKGQHCFWRAAAFCREEFSFIFKM